jgi:SAM-dependent methyltransferase
VNGSRPAHEPDGPSSPFVDIQCGRVETSPYPDGYFTKVSSVNSIFYWSDARQGVAKIYRILQEEGKLVLTYTCKRDLEKKGVVQYGVKTYEEEEIQLMLAKAGFREIKAIRSWDRHREFICMAGRK